ncbi:MAG: hypothetical protein ACQKBT_04970 [Puniceicoccales bacterium]
MIFISRILAVLAAVAFMGLGSVELSAEVNPDAEVKSFTFRKFNDKGLRLWDLSGQEAVFVNDNVLQIIQMQLEITSTKEQGDTVLRSPDARIYVEDNAATGDGFLFVQGDGFDAQGRDWEWRGVERKIEIRKGAKVTFDDAIRRILK